MKPMELLTSPSPAGIARRDAGLYVHIPFCRTKCVYCDFNCYAGQDHLIPPYVAALRRELEMYGARGWRAETLYFGGGTPSLLAPEQVGSVVGTARTALDLRDAEVTLEANPGSVDEPYFARLIEAGVNRVSVGIQSFREADMKRLARHHTVAEAVDAYRAARAAGLRRISLDLIYGLPDQSLEDWRENVDRALDLGPDHVSLYALVVEEGTPLARLVARGKVAPPDDDLMADMYELAHERMGVVGLRRYEVSSWAAPDQESRHNLIYWANRPYVGAGAGAHGLLDGGRYSNELLPVRYIRRVASGALPEVEREEIGPELERAETVILGLRLEEGVGRAEYRDRYSEDVLERFGLVLREYSALDLVIIEAERVRLTDRGRLLSNEVFQRLLPDTDPA